MIAVKHTPVRPVPTHSLDPKSMQGAKMAVNVAPGSLNDEQKQALRAWTRQRWHVVERSCYMEVSSSAAWTNHLERRGRQDA